MYILQELFIQRGMLRIKECMKHCRIRDVYKRQNALSVWLEVEIYNEGKIYKQRYERGKTMYSLKVVGEDVYKRQLPE